MPNCTLITYSYLHSIDITLLLTLYYVPENLNIITLRLCVYKLMEIDNQYIIRVKPESFLECCLQSIILMITGKLKTDFYQPHHILTI